MPDTINTFYNKIYYNLDLFIHLYLLDANIDLIPDKRPNNKKSRLLLLVKNWFFPIYPYSFSFLSINLICNIEFPLDKTIIKRFALQFQLNKLLRNLISMSKKLNYIYNKNKEKILIELDTQEKHKNTENYQNSDRDKPDHEDDQLYPNLIFGTGNRIAKLPSDLTQIQ